MRLTFQAGQNAAVMADCGACHAPQSVAVPAHIKKLLTVLVPGKAVFSFDAPGQYICEQCWHNCQLTGGCDDG